jgi:acyl-CoA thioester hydrolase
MKIEVPVHLRWSDMDAYGHVNNVDMMRLLEMARIEAFWASDESEVEGSVADAHGSTVLAEGSSDTTASTSRPSTKIIDAGPSAATFTLVARHEIEYLAPLRYRSDPVIVELWIGHIGGASIDISYRIRDDRPRGGTTSHVYAIASTTLVMVDRETGNPRRITAAEREAWLDYVDEPVAFRHRR